MAGVQKFAIALLLVAIIQCAAGGEVRRIREITEGPYQKYSAQPLVELGGNFYYFESNIQANWYQALEFCRNVGLHLVAIETEEENALIVGHLAEIGYKDYWLSGTDLADNGDGTFRWASTGKALTFADWAPGEPSYDRNEDCVDLWFRNGFMKYNDANCYSLKNVICEQICETCL